MTEPASSIHSQIEEERTAAQPNAADVRQFRRYSRGKQRGTLTPGQQQILRGLTGNRFADNVCGMVLSQIANRVLLRRFSVGGDDAQAGAAAAVEQTLRGLWTLNQLPVLSAAVHYATLRDGNHAVALGWSDGRVLLARERWWNGDTGMYVAYDSTGAPRYAVKDWRLGAVLRRTIYWPGELARYVGEGDAWRPYRLDSDPDGTGPIPWVDAAGDPLGIPVVHFAARDVPSDGDDRDDAAPAYGTSALDGGVLGLQDEINDVQRDISAAARFTAYQMYWATGITPDVDAATGRRSVAFRIEPGALLWDESAQAGFGTLQAGSLVELARTLTIKLQAVSRMTGVPQHQISGDWPSGEALLRAERALIDRATALIRVFGPAWASVAHKATRLENAFGAGDLDTALLISAVFEPAEQRDAAQRAAVATIEAPFVSEQQTLRTLGYGPDEIARILAERADEAQARAALAPVVMAPATNGQGVSG